MRRSGAFPEPSRYSSNLWPLVSALIGTSSTELHGIWQLVCFPSSLGFNQVDIQSLLFGLGNDTLEASTPSLGCMMLTPQPPAAGGMCYLLPCNSLASKLTVQPHLKFFHSRSSMKSEQYCVFRKKNINLWMVGSSLKSDWRGQFPD